MSRGHCTEKRIETYSAPNHMSNLHVVVVHYVRQVVGRMTVRLQEDRIIVDAIDKLQLLFASSILARLAVDQILEHRVLVGLEPDHVWLSLGCPLGGFFCGDVKAGSVVAQR